ncbi:unnamed protein product [Pelagomonas calceolata]|uniref:Endonuclease/exonuclease/phosphatase domain-containing protein n=1 Tax=Pelagomonas calceolata TaxID=35677 RepID=A0A8J2SEC3_9STRA|nr:unnamed protein product [Pelagomonas calceolata]|mmetsp:Transcript_24810/g.75576  ORF Transcript_24810/g.75576 Transcript_24810/m.75576 type:complete len:611 (-) Transcript_24810:72-1904(-)
MDSLPKPTSWLQGGGACVVAARADAWFIVDSVARLSEALRDVDINADNNKQKVAEVCARFALAFLNADRLEEAWEWGREAQTFDNDNEIAQWCEAEANNKLDTRLGRAVELYRGLAFGSGNYANSARSQLNPGIIAVAQLPPGSIRRRYWEQRAELSKDKGNVVHRHSRAKDLKGFGPETLRKLDSQGNDSLDATLRQVQLWPKPGKKLVTVENLYKLVDETPPQSGKLLERTLRAFRATSKKIVSCNIKLMNPLDYSDSIFEGVLRDKAKNFARLVVREEADMFVVQEAPGAALRNKGKVNGNARRCVKNGTFLDELLRNLVENSDGDQWRAESREVPKYEGKVDMGESHVFAWREDAFSLVDGPSLLCVVDSSSERFHRPPSWCVFDVRRPGVPTGERLLIVSVHLKAVQNNDTTRTREDVRVLGRAVVELQRQQRGTVTVIIVGDFNASPTLVVSEFQEAGLGDFVSALDNSKFTNMYRFCGNGADGHVYDGVYTSNRGQVEGGVLDVPEVDAAYNEMKDKAPNLMAGDLCAIMHRIVYGGDAAIVDLNGVPLGLRTIVREELYRQWSDHMPIYAKYSCLMASDADAKDTGVAESKEDEGVSESKGN